MIHGMIKLRKSFLSTPLKRKLAVIEDMKFKSLEDKCDVDGCGKKIANVSMPCMETKLCNKHINEKKDNQCNKCRMEVDEWIPYSDYKTSKIPPFDKCLTENCKNQRSFCVFPCGCFGYCERCKDRHEQCYCGKKINKWIKIYGDPHKPFECKICYSNQNIVYASSCGHLMCSSCKFRYKDAMRRSKCPYCQRRKPIWRKIHYQNYVQQLKD